MCSSENSVLQGLWGSRSFAHRGVISLSISPIINQRSVSAGLGEGRTLDACFPIKGKRRQNVPENNAARVANRRSLHSPFGHEQQVEDDIGDGTGAQGGGRLPLMTCHDQQEGIQ